MGSGGAIFSTAQRAKNQLFSINKKSSINHDTHNHATTTTTTTIPCQQNGLLSHNI
jgi:hypothetical protein